EAPAGGRDPISPWVVAPAGAFWCCALQESPGPFGAKEPGRPPDGATPRPAPRAAEEAPPRAAPAPGIVGRRGTIHSPAGGNAMHRRQFLQAGAAGLAL